MRANRPLTSRLLLGSAALTVSRSRLVASLVALLALVLTACGDATPPPGSAQGAVKSAPRPLTRGRQPAAPRVEAAAYQQQELAQLGPTGVFGRLLDADGAPAVGARIFLLAGSPDPRSGAASDATSKPLVAASALVDGRFALPCSVAANADGVVWALLPGHADLSTQISGAGNWRDLGVLQLTRGRLVKGSVTVLGSGEPIAHATVRVTPSRAELDAGLRRVPGREGGIAARAGLDGRFELGPLPTTGEVTFSATARGFSRQLQIGVDLGGAPDQQVHFVLKRGTELSGLVRRSDGAVVAGARIEAWPQDSELPALVTHSSAQGTFTVDGLESHRYYLVRCHADGLRLATMRDVVGGADQLDIVLQPAAIISVRVVGLESVGAKSARVAVRRATSPDYEELTSGRVTLQDRSPLRLAVESAGKFVVTVEVPGGTLSASAPFELSLDDSAHTLSVSCQVPGAVRGQVLDAQGRPIEAAEVAVVPRPSSLAASLQGRRTATCDDEGRYLIEGLTAGGYTVEARHPMWCRSTHADVKISRGVDRALIPLILQRGARVVGSWSREGTPKARISVLVTPAEAVTLSATSEVLADGRFELGEALPPGTYTLRVYVHDPAGTAKPRLVALSEFAVVTADDVITVTPRPR